MAKKFSQSELDELFGTVSDVKKGLQQVAKEVHQSTKLEAKTNNIQAKIIDQQNKQIKELRSFRQQMAGMGSIFSKQRINYEISRMSPAMATLARATIGQVSVMAGLQERANAFGRGIGTVAPMSMRPELSNGLGGFTEQVKSELSAREAGVRVGPAMRDLVTGMRLTGQNELKLIEAIKTNTQVGGLSAEGQENLAKTLDRTTKEYGIKTDVLVRGLADLQTSMTQNFFNITDTMEPAITQLAGELNLTNPELLRRYVNDLMSINSQSATHIAGVTEQVQTILDENSSVQDKVDAIRSTFQAFGAKVTQLAEMQGMDRRINRSLADQMYGQTGMIALSLSRMTGDRKTQLEEQSNFNDNLKTVGLEITSKLQEVAFAIFGGSQTGLVEAIRANTGALMIAASVQGGIGVFRGANYWGGVIKNRGLMKQEGIKDLIKNYLMLNTAKSAVDLAKGGDDVAEAAGAASSGAATRAAARAASKNFAKTALKFAGWAGLVTTIGFTLYEINDLIKTQINNEKENLQRKIDELNTTKPELQSATGAATLRTIDDVKAYEAALQKENVRLTQDILKELKKFNSNKATSVQKVGL